MRGGEEGVRGERCLDLWWRRRRVYVCWLRDCGTMPSSPLGSPARSLRHAVREPSDPGLSVCPRGREERGWKAERATDREGRRERVWATVQPIWDVLHRQSVPEVTDKADPIFVERLKVPSEKMSFRRGIYKKNASRRFWTLNQSKGPWENKGVEAHKY